jgi:hypothetical protein
MGVTAHMKVPPFDQMSPLRTPSRGYPRVRAEVTSGGYHFGAICEGWQGTWIDADLPDGSTLTINIRTESGQNYPIVGYAQRKSSFGLYLKAPGSRDGIGLVSALTDTSELRSDPRLAKTIPIVEAAFAAIPLIAAAAAELYDSERATVAATEAAEEAARAAGAAIVSPSLDRFKQ